MANSCINLPNMHPPFHALIVLTHGTNQYRYKAISCVVPDDHGKGMQVYNRNYML